MGNRTSSDSILRSDPAGPAMYPLIPLEAVLGAAHIVGYFLALLVSLVGVMLVRQ
jgi:hypothetical protein